MRLLALGMLLLAALPAFGWGAYAHKVVATAAESDLPDEVKREVRKLLGNKSLADVAAQPDDWRLSRPESRAWHSVEIPFQERGYSAVRDCSDGNCVVAAIERFESILADRDQPAAKRADALIFLAHLIADVHQPLHVTSRNNDRNGSTVKVRFGSVATTLHEFWDSRMFATTDVAAHARQLLALRNASPKEQWALSSGNAESWANESHRLSQQFVYGIPADGKLTSAYVNESRTIAGKQLLRASQRLRATLIRALGAKK